MADVERMKESGIEWIGEIPEGWRVKAIKRDFDLIAGTTPKSEVADYWDGDVVWITPADYKTQDKYVSHGKRNITKAGYDSCGTQLVPKGSLVFSKRAPIGTVAIADCELCTNQGCISLIPKNADSVFFYYALSVFTEQFELLGSGTTFKEISANSLANFKFAFPPLAEQRRIAEVLDGVCGELDGVIEKTRASIEEYKKLKQSVITEAVTKGIRPHRPLRPSGIEWIGEIPEEWVITRAKNILTKLERPTDKNDKVVICSNSGKAFYRGDKSTGLMSMTESDYQGVMPGDLLIHGMDTWHGAIAVSNIKGKITSVVHVCDSKENKRYIMYYLRCLAFMNVYKAITNGVRQNTSDYRSWGKAGTIDLIIPPKSEQDEIVRILDEKCEAIERIISEKEKFIAELERFKRSLIYEYVTGKRRAPMGGERSVGTCV